MNMFISILNDVFACVQAEILMQQNEYEMLDYITSNLRTWLGFSNDDKDIRTSTPSLDEGERGMLFIVKSDSINDNH